MSSNSTDQLWSTKLICVCFHICKKSDFFVLWLNFYSTVTFKELETSSVFSQHLLNNFQNLNTFHLLSSIEKGLCVFCCIFLKFLNFEIFQSFNLCGAQVLRDENGKCYNLVTY